ncbi:MAG: hypothetical protein ACREQ9_01260, partial [Candidatus Binatia bacterium]
MRGGRPRRRRAGAPAGLLLVAVAAAGAEEPSPGNRPEKRREIVVSGPPQADPRVSVTVNGARGRSRLTIGSR